MRTPELKRIILRLVGNREFYGYEIHKKLEQRNITIGIGRLYSILNEMKEEAFLTDRWERSERGPKRRIYRIAKKGKTVRDEILGDAIKTVHEFYMEYLFDLPAELSVFNTIGDLLAENIPKTANVAYIASRFSGPVAKIIETLQERFTEGNLYAISQKGKNGQLKLDSVSIVDGTLDDIPMKDEYLDLLIVTGNITSDCLDKCLQEWRRVLDENGRLAIVTPTALLAKYSDPLDIGEFVEQREHPQSDADSILDFEILSNGLEEYFDSVDIEKIVHISIIRGSNHSR